MFFEASRKHSQQT